MPAIEANILEVRDSDDISKLKTNTQPSSSYATFSAIFIAKDVLPILGLPAITIRSSFCNPWVTPSTALKPEEMPINSPCFFDNSSSLSNVGPTYSSIFFNESSLVLFSDNSNILASASLRISSLVLPLGSSEVLIISCNTFFKFLSIDWSFTRLA